MMVRSEVMRGRFRNSFSKPAFVANKKTAVNIKLQDDAYVQKGHKIQIQIQSTVSFN
jgi:predicted acyl esterase